LAQRHPEPLAMNFKVDYLAATGVNPSTYADPETAVRRLHRTYLTTRRGRIDGSVTATIWNNILAPLTPGFAGLQGTERDYDAFATEHILAITEVLRGSRRGDFGIAQKIFNLFAKDLWALGSIPSTSERLLHLPLDRRVLSKLNGVPAAWSSWSTVGVGAVDQRDILATYLQIQARLRDLWRQVIHRFISPIEMDQFIWYQVPFTPPQDAGADPEPPDVNDPSG